MLWVVSDTTDVNEVSECCTRVEAAVYRPVNPTILTATELAELSGSSTACALARSSWSWGSRRSWMTSRLADAARQADVGAHRSLTSRPVST